MIATAGARQPSDGAEAWCRDCTAPATDVVATSAGRQYLCADHAATLMWKLYAPAMGPLHVPAPTTIPCGWCDKPVPVASDHGQVVYCSPEHERSNRYTGGAL